MKIQKSRIVFYSMESKEEVEEFVSALEEFVSTLSEIVSDESVSFTEFQKRIDSFLKGRKIMENMDDAVLTSMGENLIRTGQYDRGIFLLQNALKRSTDGNYADGITLFLRLAEYEFTNGREEKGIEYITHVCEQECDNYVEAIGFRDLTDIWLKYKHYVEGKVRASMETIDVAGMNPEECSKKIEDIFENEDTLLEELSVHLNEISANGECLNYLNNWERKIFYIDELWSEVNSGGFDAYLYYYGVHFERAFKAAEEMKMLKLHSLLEKVKDAFPKSKIPKSLDKIQEKMEDKDLDFEEFDIEFSRDVEGEISDCLRGYIMENKKRLR